MGPILLIDAILRCVPEHEQGFVSSFGPIQPDQVGCPDSSSVTPAAIITTPVAPAM